MSECMGCNEEVAAGQEYCEDCMKEWEREQEAYCDGNCDDCEDSRPAPIDCARGII